MNWKLRLLPQTNDVLGGNISLKIVNQQKFRLYVTPAWRMFVHFDHLEECQLPLIDMFWSHSNVLSLQRQCVMLDWLDVWPIWLICSISYTRVAKVVSISNHPSLSLSSHYWHFLKLLQNTIVTFLIVVSLSLLTTVASIQETKEST